MKRFLSIALLSTFLFSTIGVVASTVTCNMKQMKVKTCCAPTNPGCCEKQVKLLKLNDDFLSNEIQKVARPFEFQFIAVAQVIMVRSDAPSVCFLLPDIFPPPPTGDDRLVFIQSFLI